MGENLRLGLSIPNGIGTDRMIEPLHEAMLSFHVFPMHLIYVREHRQAIAAAQTTENLDRTGDFGKNVIPLGAEGAEGETFKLQILFQMFKKGLRFNRPALKRIP